MFETDFENLHYKKLFIHGAYMAIITLAVLGTVLDGLIGNATDAYLDAAYGLFVFVVYRSVFSRNNLLLSAWMLFWISAGMEFAFLELNAVDINLIFAIFIPIIAFIAMPKRQIIVNLFVFYVLLIAYLVLYARAHPENLFVHNSRYMVSYTIAHGFMIFYGIFYYRSIVESMRRLAHSNREKSLLLREVHHRVKNNLNLIASMLGLQEERADTAPYREALADNRRRIESMAILHEILYKSDRLHAMDIAQYIDVLLHHLIRSEGEEASTTLVQEVAPVHLSLDQTIQLGIVLNELITNSIKHAQDADGRLTIRIVFQPSDHGYLFRYCDGATHVDRSALRHGFGSRLIDLSIRSLGGTLAISTDEGLCYNILFDFGSAVHGRT